MEWGTIGSPFYQTYQRALGVADMIYSNVQLAGGAVNRIYFSRPPGDQPFDEVDR